mgnify:CR=1 FL=1
MSGSPNIQDTDAETQKLYYDYLSYFVKLRQEGALQDMTMSEFALWYKRNVPVGAAQIYDAKEILTEAGKNIFGPFRPKCGLHWTSAKVAPLEICVHLFLKYRAVREQTPPLESWDLIPI